MDNHHKASKAILAAKDIIISAHRDPDGDAIGSILALGLGLEGIGKRVYMVSADGVPKRYTRLPGAKRIIKRTNKICDLAIAVDCDDKEVLGRTYDIFSKAKTIIEIDHHVVRKSFGDIAFVDPEAAATGEMVYKLLKQLKIPITKEMAENILTAIIVETNSFSFPDTSQNTFLICADLMSTGINFYKLTNMIYWSKTKEAVILSGICMSRCKFLEKGKIAWSIIRKKDFDRIKGKDEDVDAVADEIRAIKSVKLVLLFREKSKDTLRVSLRSKGNVNVAHLAERFGGGGHFDVAGCRVPNRPRVIKDFLSRARKLVRRSK
jgi:phosphoesterase RecJ-like protein